jgi:hypothetical protein
MSEGINPYITDTIGCIIQATWATQLPGLLTQY